MPLIVEFVDYILMIYLGVKMAIVQHMKFSPAGKVCNFERINKENHRSFAMVFMFYRAATFLLKKSLNFLVVSI